MKSCQKKAQLKTALVRTDEKLSKKAQLKTVLAGEEEKLSEVSPA
ncbi:hypothetical protein [Mesobacillus jeotgali]|nr:hypothetical protein [Mesobacillus jeotgali]UYZ24165.1 hypothetical protein FOF60_11775 [Mesobacillus jeotgali]